MQINVFADPPTPVERVMSITVRGADGLDAVELKLRFDKETGPEKARKILTRVVLETLRELEPRRG